MGDFLSNLVSKSRAAGETVRPRSPALFEPTAAGDGLPPQTARGSDSAWHDAQEAGAFDSAQPKHGEWGATASLAPRLTAAGEAAPSAATPPSMSSSDPRHPRRPQDSSPRPPRPRSTPSPRGAGSGTTRRLTGSDRPPAAPESEVSLSTAAPPTVPTESRSDGPEREVRRVRPAVTRRTGPTQSTPAPSSPVLETDVQAEASNEVAGQRRPGTARLPPQSRVEPMRPAPGPSPAAASLGFPPEAAGESAGRPPPRHLSLPESKSLGAERSMVPRPRVIAHPDPGEPSGTARHATGDPLPAESAGPQIFPPVEPATSPSQPSTGGQPAPTIQVTIGRVEVRAVTPPPSEALRPRPTRRESVLTLDEYLKQRNEESR
jgi:hypothetical protein